MIERPGSEVPWLTTDQMIEVDRVMVEELGIRLIQMMENAGRNLAHLARERFLGGDPRGRRVVVLAGSGGNGGGALTAARRLHGWGAEVRVFLSAPERRLGRVPAHQLDIVHRIGIPVGSARDLAPASLPADLIVDGILGYSLEGAPRGDAAAMIGRANEHPAPVLALDVPSGVDATTGDVHEPAVVATATITLALPKTGLRAAAAERHVGELYLADIAVPPEAYAGPGLELEVDALFAGDDIVRLI